MLSKLQSTLLKIILVLIVGLSLGQVSAQEGDTSQILDIQWSNNSQYLAKTLDNHQIEIYDVQQKQVVSILAPDIIYTSHVTWLPGDEKLAIYGNPGKVEIWDLKKLEIEEIIQIDFPFALQPFWSPDGRYIILIGGGDQTPNLFIWDIRSQAVIFEQTIALTLDAKWSHDGTYLAVSAIAPHITLFDIEHLSDKKYLGLTLTEIYELIKSGEDTGNDIFRLDWSLDDKYIVTGAVLGEVTLWDVATNEIVYLKNIDELILDDPLISQFSRVSEVWFNPTGTTFNSLSVDGMYRTWEVRDGALRSELSLGVEKPIHLAAISPDKNKLAYLDMDGKLSIIPILYETALEDLKSRTEACVTE